MLWTILKKIIDIALENRIEHGLINITNKEELKKFYDEIEQWCIDFFTKNEATVITSGKFNSFLENCNLVENIFNFISFPENVLEADFIQKEITLAIEQCREESKQVSTCNKQIISEFINSLFIKIKTHFERKVDDNDKAILYYEKQNNKLLNIVADKIDGLSKKGSNSNLTQENIPIIPSRDIFDMPKDTIIRKFVSFEELRSNSYFSHPEDMLSGCIKERHIALLGEAGNGKSIALAQIASIASHRNFYVVLFSLNQYTNETIEKIIYDIYPNLSNQTLFLIFDAFDEIEEKNRNDFAKKINYYVSRHPDSIVVISCRNNFYTFSDDNGSGGTFAGFKEYGISPITRSDIKEYLIKNKIDIKKFFKEIDKKKLRDLITNPFYLKELVRIFSHDKAFPSKSELMEGIICSRFNMDKIKYVTTKSLNENIIDINNALEKVSFAIQCLRTSGISNVDYQSIVTDSYKRELLKYSGIFSKKSNDSYIFEHNNFREYLTAKYINRLDIDNIQKIVFNRDGKILTSWLNVLSYLIPMRNDDDLRDLLISQDKESVVKFEANRVEESERTQICIDILNDFAQKNMWLSFGRNSAEEITVFGQSSKLLNYLINQIENPINFRSQSNALTVISCFLNLYNQENHVREVLMSVLISEKTRNYEKVKVLNAIAELKLSNDKIIAYVIDAFFREKDIDFKSGILKFITSLKLCDKYIDIYINFYETVCKNRFDSFDIYHSILDGFESANEPSSLSRILLCISKANNHSTIENESYKVILNNVFAAYNSGYEIILYTVLDLLYEIEMHNRPLFHECVRFIKETDTILVSFLYLVDKSIKDNNNIMSFVLEQFANTECYEKLLHIFEENPNKYKSITESIAYRLKETDLMYERYKNVLYKNGIIISRVQHTDYERARLAGKQRIFNSLFDKVNFYELIHSLLLLFGNKNITFSQLWESDFYTIESNYDLSAEERQTYITLYYLLVDDNCKENHDEVLQTIQSITAWDEYVTSLSYDLLYNNDNITTTEEQRKFFYSYCLKNLKEIDFKKDIKDDGKNSTKYTYRALYVIFFSEHFNFTYNKEIYLSMTVIPTFFWPSNRNFTNNSFPKYITNHLSEEELDNQIKTNLSHNDLSSNSIETHIGYCKEKNKDWAVPIAEQVCQDPSKGCFVQSEALEYLESIKGYEYLYDKFLYTEQKDLFDCLVRITISNKDIRLKERLEVLNSESSDGQAYLNELLSLNSLKGLQCYYKTAKNNMKSSKCSGEYNFDNTLYLIHELNDVSLIDCIDDLRVLVFTEGFQDLEHFGLQNSIYNAYKNISTTNYSIVKEHIDSALKNKCISDDEKAFCNSLLSDIDFIHSKHLDSPWRLTNIKSFCIEYEKKYV